MLSDDQIIKCHQLDENLRKIDIAFNHAVKLLDILNNPEYRLILNQRAQRSTFPIVLVRSNSYENVEILVGCDMAIFTKKNTSGDCFERKINLR